MSFHVLGFYILFVISVKMTGTIAKQLGPGNCLRVSGSDGRSNYFTAIECKNTFNALCTNGKDILNRFSNFFIEI